jgi:ketosteroid isomerase-like protein
MSEERAVVGPQQVGAGETAGAFARVLLGGDARAAASYFAPSAQLLTPDGTALSGRDSIAELLGQLTSASNQLLEIKTGRTLHVDQVALCTQYWALRSRRGAAVAFKTASTARLVLAQAERRWQILIAAPWG